MGRVKPEKHGYCFEPLLVFTPPYFELSEPVIYLPDVIEGLGVLPHGELAPGPEESLPISIFLITPLLIQTTVMKGERTEVDAGV